MKIVKQFGIFILSLATIYLVACSGGGSGSGGGTGTLSIALTDSSCGSYAAIYVTINEVQVNKNNSLANGNSGWRTVAKPMKTYNLLQLINGVTEVLGDDELGAGFYNQIRLIIGKTPESENNINGVPHPYANYVLFDDGSDEPLKIPSGYNTGIKLVHNFEVEEDSFVELLLDFEACKSVVETGSGKYILKPTIKVIETLNKFNVFGEVTENDADTVLPITGALVSAQISDGLSASVVRSTLTSAADGEEGEYMILLSPGQTYNIVVYSEPPDNLVDGDQIYLPACEEITIPLDEDIEQNFTLEQSNFGTITGDVEVSGEIHPLEEERPVVYISFFSRFDCGSGFIDDYIEVTSLSMSPDENGNISFSVDLPLGEYDVVASSQGFVPDTAPMITLTNPGDSEDVSLSL